MGIIDPKAFPNNFLEGEEFNLQQKTGANNEEILKIKESRTNIDHFKI